MSYSTFSDKATVTEQKHEITIDIFIDFPNGGTSIGVLGPNARRGRWLLFAFIFFVNVVRPQPICVHYRQMQVQVCYS